MTSDDRDDSDDDPLLRSMRPVWLAMRDEDPPERGLSDLLAAARTKAETMKPEPSWWRRALVFAIRPPVLAAATVLVLVGGAVVISRHRGELDAVAIAPREEQKPTVTERWRGANAGSEADEGRGKLDLSRDVGSGSSAPPEPKPVGTEAVHVPATRSPVPRVVPRPAPKPEETVRPEKPADPGGNTPEVETVPNENTTKGNDPAPGPDSGELMIAGEDDEKRPAPEAGRAQTPSHRGPVSGRSQPEVVDQLVKQAEVAAVRKDCPAVRAMAQRIKKLDSATYKSRVTRQPAIASCLR